MFFFYRLEFESEHGDDSNRANVQRLMPKRVKRRRRVDNEAGGGDAAWEEYFDYIFPEDENAKPNLKLLAMAKMWKKQKETEPQPEEEPLPVKVETDDDTVAANPDAIDVDDIDADDEDIRNESSSSDDDDDDDDNDEPPEKRNKND